MHAAPRKAGGESRLVAILADTISQVEGPAKTAVVMTRLLGTLDEDAAQPLCSCS